MTSNKKNAFKIVKHFINKNIINTENLAFNLGVHDDRQVEIICHENTRKTAVKYIVQVFP